MNKRQYLNIVKTCSVKSQLHTTQSLDLPNPFCLTLFLQLTHGLDSEGTHRYFYSLLLIIAFKALEVSEEYSMTASGAILCSNLI